MSAITARGEFDEHKNWYVDPALLEWHGMTPDHRRFLLSMSPITQTPSTVTILIVIPHLQRLELDVAGSRRTIPASAFARATAQDRAIAARAEFVTPDESLYAGPIDPPATHEGVQRYVRSDLVLCDDGDEAHDAVMHFTIANGHVHDFSIDGVPEPARGCVAEIADHWTFLEFENTIRVNYPLHFINLR
jgi:hypothetical protein